MHLSGLSIELQHTGRLCFAMHQNAVPWLTGLRLVHRGGEPLRDLRVTLELQPGFTAPHELHVAEVPANGALALDPPDLTLAGTVLANTVERTRADLVVRVHRGDDELALRTEPVCVLAYNEWPGLGVMPALVAAFVQPNHPALAPLVLEVAQELQQHTGDSALDGYQRGDVARVRRTVAAVFAVLARREIVYVAPPPSFEQHGQKVRTPEQVLGERLGTCFDLTLLAAALLEHVGIAPLCVFQHGHAFVGAWTLPGSTPEVELGPAVELRKRSDAGAMVFFEATTLCGAGAKSFETAVAAARQRLADDERFHLAVDVEAARRLGIRPLPPRTSTFELVAPPTTAGAAVAATAPLASVAAAAAAEPAPEPTPPPPNDRLEHWKGKLLDLTLYNRLLNTVATKKTVPLGAHELTALAERLQSGARFRVHPRPALGDAERDPRDLDLAARRSGVDVRPAWLDAELRAGRLRADLDDAELDRRLVEVFRHARTSLEESGANTLYLALGFLRWFESPQATKPRRAPLLLLPLVIERSSVQDGFRFVLDDDEPRLNQSLLAMLAHDFDLRTGLADVPELDDGTVDVRAVLDAFRGAAMAMPRWEVEESAWIGFFSFTKYLMWLDLAAREELLQSPVLRHLVERPGASFVQDVPEVPRDELDDVDPATVYCPKDADSSQLAAVLAGAAGRTFVLEGPPGTGKSQTITNLIAQSLANGKRVLFVAEKRAALEVVQRRLDDVGIGAFCIELHSSKSGPKALLAQLGRALDTALRREPAEWNRVAAELQTERERLNTVVRALHRRRSHGVSVFTAMGRLVQLVGAPRLALPELRGAAPDAIEAARTAVERLAGAAASLGVPQQEPWWGVRLGDWTPAIVRDLPPVIERLAAAAAAMQAAIEPVARAFGLTAAFGDAGPSARQLVLLARLCERCSAPSLPPSAWLACDWRALAPRLREAAEHGARRERVWSQLEGRWRPELLDLELEPLVATWRDAVGSWFVRRWWRLREPRRTLRAVAVEGRLGPATDVLRDLEHALQVRAEDRALAALADAAALLGAHWRSGRADWAAVTGWIEWVEDVRSLLVRIVPGALQPDPDALAALAAQLDGIREGAATLPAAIGALREATDELGAARRAAAQRLELDEVEAYGGDDAPGHAAAIGARARRWSASLPRLRDHCAFRRAADAAEAAGVGALVAAHAHGELGTEALLPAFERAFLEDWLDGVHREEPELARFRGADHERTIARFAELDRRAIRLAADVVLARVAAQLPQLRDTNVQSSELGILERERKKQRRHKPVRRLLAEIPSLFARLAPCLLMSPLSVVQFLGRSRERFDLVVFDEASQIPMWDAASAIGRGESLIVVGDSRQLPPTSFFQRQAQGDEPAPDELPEDLESVLDECAAAGLPRMHLAWHYRSRHESLIAFSNHHYYQNRLLTFPSPHRAGLGQGVRCVVVEDGVYDRAGSQTNPREAERLVAEVVARLRDPTRTPRSIGIVTFSRAQQMRIEDLLDRERALHPELEAAFGGDEPLFVKNLENVQGDERDVIYFSICYARDAAGKVYENYGPLNVQGGERRLNVAVTRARHELVVFTSVRPEQVANRTPALGARHLRTFLDYALRGEAALLAAVEADPSRGVESPFEAAVRDALVQRGHEVHTQVGCSGYRIDLAIVDPEAPGRYLLGVECDGASYHSAATARDRDRLRAAVLQGLGWRLCRVWSTDFWQDPVGEIDRVEAALAAARAEFAAPPPVPAAAGDVATTVEAAEADTAAARGDGVTDAAVGAGGEAVAATGAAVDPTGITAGPSAERAAEPADRRRHEPESPPADPDGPRPYPIARLPHAGDADAFATPRALPVLAAQCRALLEVEAPIAFDRLARRLAATWLVSRVTERVRERLRAALPADAAVVDEIVWTAACTAESFRGFRVPDEADPDGIGERPAEDLPIVEVANAMHWLLRQHAGLADDDLAREAARCFGIQRLGSQVRDVMQRALELLLATGRGRRDGDLVRLP